LMLGFRQMFVFAQSQTEPLVLLTYVVQTFSEKNNCQLQFLELNHFINLPFVQHFILSTCFAPIFQLANFATWTPWPIFHIISLPFPLLGILST
jgi:hypothetical protein